MPQKPRAKKKAARRPATKKKKTSKTKKAAKRPAKKKTAVKKSASAKRKAKSTRSPTKKKAKSNAGPKASIKAKKVKKPSTLGRPRLPGDAKLDLLFQKDYQAREIFAFLGVQTLRELEEHSPDEIIERLTGPMVQTVERIRKALAMSNRCLAKDGKFALKFQRQLKRGR